jgi:hypothetical protein
MMWLSAGLIDMQKSVRFCSQLLGPVTFLLVSAMLRKLLPDAQIGLFFHVASASSEVPVLAPCKEFLEGMLGLNLVGIQTEEYCHLSCNM